MPTPKSNTKCQETKIAVCCFVATTETLFLPEIWYLQNSGKFKSINIFNKK